MMEGPYSFPDSYIVKKLEIKYNEAVGTRSYSTSRDLV